MADLQWSRVRRIFESALDAPREKRADLLTRECDGDQSLLITIEAMLREHDETGPLDLKRPKLLEDLQFDLLGAQVLRPSDMVADRYRIEHMLGAGGMGEVYEAYDLKLDTPVALKTIRQSLVYQSKSFERFRSEILLARRITHPSVCRVFDFGTHNLPEAAGQLWFLTMELLHGETLSERIAREGRLSPAEALSIGEQIAEGLDAVHQEQVIHRDLKTANVFLTSGDKGTRAKLTDFGLARSTSLTDPQQHSTTTVGTPAYMAPEQLEGEQATPASDIYAFGLILYEMVTGRQAFTGPTPFAAAIKRLKEKPEPPSRSVEGLPHTWDEAVLQCLDVDPAKRLTRASDAIRLIKASGRQEVRFQLPPWWRYVAAALALIVGVISLTLLRPSPEGYNAKPEAKTWFVRGVNALNEGDLIAARRSLENAAASDPNYYMAHARLAEVRYEMDAVDSARDHILRAIAIHSRTMPSSSVDRTQLEAIQLTVLRDHQGALKYYEQLVQDARGDSRDAAELDLARAYERAENIGEALKHYRKLAEKHVSTGAVQVRIGVLLSRMQDSAGSQAAFEKAASFYEAAGNYNALMETLYQHAAALCRNRRAVEAQPLLERALAIAKITQSETHRNLLMLQMGVAARQANDTEKARKLLEEALAIAAQQEMETTALQGLIDLGNVYLQRDELEPATKLFQRALAVAREQKNRRSEARALLSLASVRVQERDPVGATEYAEEALEFYRAGGYLSETRQGLTLLARARELYGDRPGALAAYQEQLRAAHDLGDSARIASLELSVATALRKLERYTEALPHYDAALKRDDRVLRAYVRRGKAETLWRLGRYDEARGELSLLESENPDALNKRRAQMTRAMVELSAGKAELARTLMKGVSEKEPDTLGILCAIDVESRGDTTRCRDALAAAQERRDPDLEALARLLIAEGEIRRGQRADALTAARDVEKEFVRSSQPESALRACLVQAAAVSTEQERCNAILDNLRRLWGNDAVVAYLGRPDIALRFSLLKATPAHAGTRRK